MAELSKSPQIIYVYYNSQSPTVSQKVSKEVIITFEKKSSFLTAEFHV